ncbi:MAG: fused MFS/spermidine synthase [Pyrinomonadaceae bacterium]
MSVLGYRKWVLEVTVFVSGALVMIFEMIGSRVLSPFIGASTYVWTSLIGVILGSLSVGYWFGGRVADRRPDVKILAAVLFAAGGLIAVTILTKEVVLSTIAALLTRLELKALLAAILLFAPASVCFGFVTPFAVRLVVTSVDQTGRTVGRLYALSTIGSIAGTFAAGFFLIPFVGSVRTLYLIAVMAVGMSLLLVPFAASRVTIAALVLLMLAIIASESTAVMLRQTQDLYDLDTEYSHVQVFRTRDPETGRDIRALATDPYFVQSAAFYDSEELVLEYGRYYHLIRHFKPDLERTLIIGGAGYSFPKDYLRAYPAAIMDVVEIDPGMTEIARKYFRLKDDPRLKIVHQDGRIFINHAPAGGYDAVLMDAFGSLFTVPTHLTTVEAVANLRRVLENDGVVVFNLGSAISGPGSGFLHAELATYRSVFPNVYVFKVNRGYPEDRLQNLIIVASKAAGKHELRSADPEIARLLEHRYEVEPDDGPQILTDDLAPVEYYNSIAQNIYLRKR